MIEFDELALENQLCFALYNASRAMTKTYQPYLKELGLTYPQYIAMLSLWKNDGCSVKALGESLMLDSGTLTPLLKRLETAGFVSRQRCTKDERGLVVTLTEQGQQLKSAAVKMRQKMMCNHQGDIEKLAQLKSELQALTQSLLMG
jgi:DNA-binding MarR family transcriptional regulator